MPGQRPFPIIAMTANAFHEDVCEGYESGMNGHLAKPVDYQQLFQTIKSFLKKSSSIKDFKEALDNKN